MINYKTILVLTSIALLILISGGCKEVFDLDQRDRTFQGDPLVAFFPNTRTVADSSGVTSFEVQLIGEQLESALNIPFTVVSGETTAVEGTHFEFVTPSPVVLPANSSIATFSVNILDSDIESPRVLTVELQDPGDNITASENIKQTVITIIPN